ncbi:MAG: hypothetical protein E7413_00895 [Ruminococcaceae bacterium]|nr:hypothetical protein [Oscillospiraceae bacterium]
MKKIYITNGSGTSGKDTFAKMLSKYITVHKYSSINLVKAMLQFVGVDTEQKTEELRLLLSDMKDRLTKYDNIPFKDISEVVNNFKDNQITADVLLIDIREPDEIARAAEVFDADTILIKNPNVKKIKSNHADANVDNYNYDYIIENDGTLEQLDKMAYLFSEQVIKNNCFEKPTRFMCSELKGEI